jgi:hypothetical protein
LKPTVSPGTWKSRFFKDASPWLSSNMPDHTNYTSPINRWFYNTQYKVFIKYLTQMCQKMPMKKVILFPKSHPTLHDAHVHYRDISHFSAQSEYPKWSVLGQNQVLSR